jgi:hypothetical protein
VHTLLGLASPAHANGLTAAAALAFPAIELFVDRATDRLESFVLNDIDAPTVAEICSTTGETRTDSISTTSGPRSRGQDLWLSPPGSSPSCSST